MEGDQNKVIESVHKVLAHSYFFYFLAFLASLLLDFLFPIELFRREGFAPLGGLFLVLATLLILWAQKTGRNFEQEKKAHGVSRESFCKGPYCYTRSPTHWGLFLLMLGFGIIANAFFVVMFTIVSFFIAKLVFLEKEERILAEKYGSAYIEYKKLVRF